MNGDQIVGIIMMVIGATVIMYFFLFPDPDKLLQRINTIGGLMILIMGLIYSKFGSLNERLNENSYRS